jgi:hypothetical protein
MVAASARLEAAGTEREPAGPPQVPAATSASLAMVAPEEGLQAQAAQAAAPLAVVAPEEGLLAPAVQAAASTTTRRARQPRQWTPRCARNLPTLAWSA